MSLVYVVNPKKSKHAKKGKRKSRAAAPAKKHKKRAAPRAAVVSTRRYKRNPRFASGLVGKVTGALMPAAIGAAGAIAVDAILPRLPLPASMKAGPLRHVTNGLAAVAVGLASGLVLKPDQARQVLNGGLTVALYKAGRDAVAKVAPNFQLAELEEDFVGGFEEDLNALLTDESRVISELQPDPFGQGAGLAGAEVFNPGF